MNKQNDFRMEIEELLRKASNHTLYDILAEIDAKRYQITRLLENGWPIYENSSGQRLQNLYHQRNKLWLKVRTMDQIVSIVINHLQ